ncbi:MAG: stage III sporulation protein AD [Ruminococcus sp.]|nr:stage III sporulation protein AD [Ruminococcus sp.]
MSILSICGVAVLSVALALTVRRYSAEQAMLLSLGAGVVILLCVIKEVLESVNTISSMLAAAGIKAEYILILLKTLGICFVTEFTCDSVSEAGMASLSSNVLLAGKVLVLVTALPLFQDIFSTVTQLISGS